MLDWIVWSYWDGLGIWLTSLPFSAWTFMCCRFENGVDMMLITGKKLAHVMAMASQNCSVGKHVAFSKRTWRTWWHPLHFFTSLRSNVNVSLTFSFFFLQDCEHFKHLNEWIYHHCWSSDDQLCLYLAVVVIFQQVFIYAVISYKI